MANGVPMREWMGEIIDINDRYPSVLFYYFLFVGNICGQENRLIEIRWKYTLHRTTIGTEYSIFSERIIAAAPHSFTAMTLSILCFLLIGSKRFWRNKLWDIISCEGTCTATKQRPQNDDCCRGNIRIFASVTSQSFF